MSIYQNETSFGFDTSTELMLSTSTPLSINSVEVLSTGLLSRRSYDFVWK